MKKILTGFIISLPIILLSACTATYDESILYETDNEHTNWTLHSSNGYSGGNVKFDDFGWYTYEYDSIDDSQWIYESSYGVSRDGLILHLDDYYTYSFDSLTGIDNEYEYCINVRESITMDMYEFCKINPVI